MPGIGKFVDKAYEGQDFAALVNAPVASLQGVSDKMAEALKEALGVQTVGDLARNKYVLWAQAIETLSH